MRPLIIWAKGPSHKQCPFPEGVEIWGINDSYLNEPKWLNRIYQFKDISKRPEVGDVNLLIENQKKYGFDIYLATPPSNETLKKIYKPFPIREICERFKTKFFANTMCYIMAHALYTGRDENHQPVSDEAVSEIWLYGSDMRAAHEYNRELPCMDYWYGRSWGMGIPCHNTDFSSIGKYPLPTLYGDWFDTIRDIERKKYDG